ncbi:hypothetical protein N5K21_25305 [Rhizobium pusense]|uniref:Uncharacterized protein n=1 Tax=Agrobacterium pusense TaxID=648995 RepID=A0A6H0ZPN7_9HYPH|nr:hypothetical protein [Agrobacterium pusense]MDH2092048.1 hypothetical protein [Agrobacterium pusense]QIX22589.1 hypothetical protein FOB41_16285 [Agrobacterium pusense]WCK24500.1 hypothetical protein CFBP5496_0002585 [Agrobacterium pusense]
MNTPLIAATLVAATNSVGSVYAADDPAILACEEAVKMGLKAPKSYERARMPWWSEIPSF